MLLERVYTLGLAQVAYIVCNAERRVAAVIDPRRDVDVYLRWADDHDCEISAILETHVHA
ncbi:MAG: MBL fold metallo-hydrolase, partial [Chloroflexia bacterium]|nr:MBL fold metallo-hydrolase [Chloroflexia bacterium]